MCGLFGIAGPAIMARDIGIFEELMLVSSTRGIDGTGVASGSHGLKPVVARTPGDVFYWKYEHKETNRLLSISNQWIMGHTRWRSMGANGPNGVQPYVFDRVVGTHNGSAYSLPFDSNGFHTDSHMLISKINENANDPSSFLSLGLTNTDSYALVWYDRKKKKLFFATNGQRGLFYATNKKRSVFYWASELRFLHFALGGSREDCDYWSFKSHALYQLSPSEISYHKVKDNVIPYLQWDDYPKPPVIEVKPINGHGHGGNTVIMGETNDDLLQIPWMRDSETNKKVDIEYAD